jgi:hypothetical protein
MMIFNTLVFYFCLQCGFCDSFKPNNYLGNTFFFTVLGKDPRAASILDKFSTTESHPQPLCFWDSLILPGLELSYFLLPVC